MIIGSCNCPIYSQLSDYMSDYNFADKLEQNIYMLLAGWEVLIGKNCDLGHSFSLYRPTLRQPITSLSFSSCRKLAYKFFTSGFVYWNWLSFYLKLYRETHMIMRHYNVEQQTAKQTLPTSKNSIEFTDSNFPCHLKVNRDKLVLINCLWKYKRGERLTITANSCTKIDQLVLFCPL